MANCLPSALQTIAPGVEQVLPEEPPDVDVVESVAGAAAGEAAIEGAAAAGEAAMEGAAAAGEGATEGAEGATAEAPPADEPPLAEAA